MSEVCVWGGLYLHKKSNGKYKLINECVNESDLVRCVQYLSLTTGQLWVRPYRDFFDGRFEYVGPPRGVVAKD